ncbi:MAG: hypothetical protein ACI82I_001529 [Gammaproteobacteria bacterium]|jgi:hypothetical protein
MNDIISPLVRLCRRITLTEGEQSILLAYFGVAFLGAVLALNVVTSLGGYDTVFHPFLSYHWWMMISGGFGGCAGLYLGRNWMGLPGLRGVTFAILGAVWISFLGGLVGGTLALPLYGTMFGPFTLFVTLFSTPLLVTFWVCTLMAAHYFLMVWRDEQETIFDAVLSDPSETHVI